MPHRPPGHEWDSPVSSVPEEPTRQPDPRPPPRVRLFSHPRPGDFSYKPPARRPQAPQKPPSEPKRTFFSSGGRFSRRRPDVNALNQLLRQHLDLPDEPMASTSHSSPPESPQHGFFPPLRADKRLVANESRTRVDQTTSEDAIHFANPAYEDSFPELGQHPRRS